MEKSARRNTKYSRIETIFKLGHPSKAIAHLKAIVFAKWSVCVKIKKLKKNAKKQSTTTLELFRAKNRSRKRNKYSRNESILKIGHLAKGVQRP